MKIPGAVSGRVWNLLLQARCNDDTPLISGRQPCCKYSMYDTQLSVYGRSSGRNCLTMLARSRSSCSCLGSSTGNVQCWVWYCKTVSWYRCWYWYFTQNVSRYLILDTFLYQDTYQDTYHWYSPALATNVLHISSIHHSSNWSRSTAAGGRTAVRCVPSQFPVEFRADTTISLR